MLDLKIPPLLLAVLFGILMWFVPAVPSGFAFSSSFRIAAAAVLAAGGAAFLVLGIVAFRKARTTPNPMKPETASSLVTSGVYRYSRNPMYVGMVAILIAWGVFLSNLFALALAAGFGFYLNRFQIQPEEDAMDALFGEAFQNYKKQVRRWL